MTWMQNNSKTMVYSAFQAIPNSYFSDLKVTAYNFVVFQAGYQCKINISS